MKMGTIDLQIRLFDSMWARLAEEEEEARRHFDIARNMACSEWDESFFPSPSGGYHGLGPIKILPKTTLWLHRNYELLMRDITDRRKALMELFKDVFDAAGRQMPSLPVIVI